MLDKNMMFNTMLFFDDQAVMAAMEDTLQRLVRALHNSQKPEM